MKKTFRVDYSRSNGAAPKGQGACPLSLLVESDSVEARRNKSWWKWLRAAASKFCWSIFSKSILGLVYFTIISEGWRAVSPGLGTKLSKAPLLSALADLEATYRLDQAHCCSIILLIGVWTMWSKVLQLWLGAEEVFLLGIWNLQRHKELALAIAGIILFADLTFFYYALSQFGWGRSVFSFSSLAATAGYFSLIIFVTYQDVVLKQIVLDRKKELES